MSVKRNEFIQYLANHHCYLHRHGGKHDIYQNSITKKNYRSASSESGKVSLQCYLQAAGYSKYVISSICIFITVTS